MSTQDKTKCYCEQPGYFYSGIPGILAHVENGKITSTVERCDSCIRFKTDKEASDVLYDIQNKKEL
jgi:hypothetical protein